MPIVKKQTARANSIKPTTASYNRPTISLTIISRFVISSLIPIIYFQDLFENVPTRFLFEGGKQEHARAEFDYIISENPVWRLVTRKNSLRNFAQMLSQKGMSEEQMRLISIPYPVEL